MFTRNKWGSSVRRKRSAASRIQMRLLTKERPMVRFVICHRPLLAAKHLSAPIRSRYSYICVVYLFVRLFIVLSSPLGCAKFPLIASNQASISRSEKAVGVNMRCSSDDDGRQCSCVFVFAIPSRATGCVPRSV
jgi:hypothetical protein